MRVLPLLLMLGSSAAIGQAPAVAPQPPAPGPSRVGGAAPAEEIPDAEKARLSADTLKAMREVLKKVGRRVEEAKKSRDVVKLNCVNEKLTQVQGLVRISEQAEVTMQEAIARADRTTAAHEFTKLSIAREKVDQLRTETEECIGQLAFRTDETVDVEMYEPEGLPRDPSRPLPLPAVPSRPQPASPQL